MALQYLNSLQIVELSRRVGDLGEIRDHARRTLPEREALAANRELYARPRPTYLRAEAGRDGREVSDIAHIAFIEALCIDRCYGQRSEERRVGKECVSTCRSRWAQDHYKKNSLNDHKTT